MGASKMIVIFLCLFLRVVFVILGRILVTNFLVYKFFLKSAIFRILMNFAVGVLQKMERIGLCGFAYFIYGVVWVFSLLFSVVISSIGFGGGVVAIV